jgi:hypothetical protein
LHPNAPLSKSGLPFLVSRETRIGSRRNGPYNSSFQRSYLGRESLSSREKLANKGRGTFFATLIYNLRCDVSIHKGYWGQASVGLPAIQTLKGNEQAFAGRLELGFQSALTPLTR